MRFRNAHFNYNKGNSCSSTVLISILSQKSLVWIHTWVLHCLVVSIVQNPSILYQHPSHLIVKTFSLLASIVCSWGSQDSGEYQVQAHTYTVTSVKQNCFHAVSGLQFISHKVFSSYRFVADPHSRDVGGIINGVAPGGLVVSSVDEVPPPPYQSVAGGAPMVSCRVCQVSFTCAKFKVIRNRHWFLQAFFSMKCEITWHW